MANSNIKYTDKDFDSLKSKLQTYIRQNFPDTYQDFNESSSGMMLVELFSFMGDTLNYYIDHQFQELLLENAIETKNIINLAKTFAYNIKPPATSTGLVTVSIVVPSAYTSGINGPDPDLLIKLLAGTKFTGGGQTVELLDDIDFTNATDRIVSANNIENGIASAYRITKKNAGRCITGNLSEKQVPIGAFKQFRTITLADPNISEIIDIRDSEGNKYYEVDFLAQDTIYSSETNINSDSSIVPSILKLIRVPRRFIKVFNPDTGTTTLTFGGASARSLNTDIIPDITELALPLAGKTNFTTISIDPENFLNTKGFGVGPANTTLTVKYKLGGGFSTNFQAGSVNEVAVASIEFANPAASLADKNSVIGSVSVTNEKPFLGGDDGLTMDQVKKSISANFATQQRVVTDADFLVRILSMPPKFGSVFRARATRNRVNKNATTISIISRELNGDLALATNSLKQNIKTYLTQFRMLTDGVDIIDSEIINIAINFEIVANQNVNKNILLISAIQSVLTHFEISKWQLGQPIIISDIYAVLLNVPGIRSVSNVQVYNRSDIFNDRQYSLTSYSILAAEQGGIIHIPDNAIAEVKYENSDVFGTVL